MNTEQRTLIESLIKLCDGDKEFRDSTNVYGNWFEHMVDQLADLGEGNTK